MFKGTRISDNQMPARPGQYSKIGLDKWSMMFPNGRMAGVTLPEGMVIENTDGTITVNGIIELTAVQEEWKHTGWRGYLVGGIWRKA